MTVHQTTDVRAALASSDVSWRLLVDENPQPVLVFVPESLTILAANGAASTYYGYARTELTRLRMADLWAADGLAAFVAELASAPPGRRTFGRYRHVHKDGRVMSVDVVSHDLPLAAARIAVVVDVTERTALQAQLRQAQKMGALGQLTSSVAHDFSNLLTVIMTTAEFAEAALGPEHVVRADLHVMQQAARRAADLTRQLLSLSRKRPAHAEVLDLNVVLAGPLELLRRLVGAGIDVRVALAPALWPVRTDVGQIEQVLLNLVINARDAMPNGGTLTITTSNRRIEQPLPDQPGVLCGDYAVLTVRDTGIGMDAETRARIFEPFFTTKPPDRGTGLGLSLVHGIVRHWRGYVYADSAPGAGTAFSVLLPRAEVA